MMPLFYNGNFNKDGHKMRSLFEREVSNGFVTYKLWRSAGQPDLDYPRAENDAYVLYTEIGEYLAPLKITDFYLINHCGYEAAVKLIYGDDEKRELYFDNLRQLGESRDKAILEALRREEYEIERCGSDAVQQANYIKSLLDQHVSIYQKSKENGGESFPDFIGALVLDDLSACEELSSVYKAKRAEKERERKVKAEAEERAYCEERNRKADQTVSDALHVLREGGVLQNDNVEFYRSRYDSSSYSIINHLMRLYKVNVPIRTQGWINDKLISVTIKDKRCDQLRYMRAKGGQCSQKFFDCMQALIDAVSATTCVG